MSSCIAAPLPPRWPECRCALYSPTGAHGLLHISERCSSLMSSPVAASAAHSGALKRSDPFRYSQVIESVQLLSSDRIHSGALKRWNSIMSSHTSAVCSNLSSYDTGIQTSSLPTCHSSPLLSSPPPDPCNPCPTCIPRHVLLWLMQRGNLITVIAWSTPCCTIS